MWKRKKNIESNSISREDQIFHELLEAHPEAAVYGPPILIGDGCEILLGDSPEKFIESYVESADKLKDTIAAMSQIAMTNIAHL